MPNQPASVEASAGTRFELFVAVLAAVSGAVVTGVLDLMDFSAGGKLIGLACGAALPPFVATVGRRRRLRVATAVVVTGAGLLIAYSGLLGVAVASDTRSVIPTPNEIGRAVAPAPVGGRGEGDLEISYQPDQVRCDANSCDEVVVESTGTAPLRITSLEITGAAKDFVSATGCKKAVLNEGEQCTISVTFDPDGAPDPVSGALVIHQNLKGPASTVPLSAEGGTGDGGPGDGLNFAFAPGGSCTLRDDGVLAVRMPMRNSGPTGSSAPVTMVVSDGTPARLTATVGQKNLVGSVEVGTAVTGVKFLIDSEGEIGETNEQDNSAECTVT
jgi:hypothetical protein